MRLVLEVRAGGLQDVEGRRGDLGTDPVTGEKDDARSHGGGTLPIARRERGRAASHRLISVARPTAARVFVWLDSQVEKQPLSGAPAGDAFKLRAHPSTLFGVSLLHPQVALAAARDSELFEDLVGTNYGKKLFEGRRRDLLERECNPKVGRQA